MIKPNFLITGFGRTGTKFLAETLNQSKQWTVYHEPRGNDMFNFSALRDINYTYNNSMYYGEVNSYLRYMWNMLPIPNVIFLQRDPKDIILSTANRKASHLMNKYAKEIYDWYENVEMFDVSLKYPVFDFEFYTTDKEYLHKLIKTAGIHDIDVDKIDLTKKVNENKVVKYQTFEDLPYELQSYCNRLEKQLAVKIYRNKNKPKQRKYK